MFESADLDRDGLVDFNEFVALRQRSTHKRVKQAEREEARAAKGSARPKKGGKDARGDARGGGKRGGGKRSGGTRNGGATNRSEASSASGRHGPTVGAWVHAVRAEQAKGEERHAHAVREHAQMVERRFALSDSLSDLTDDELLLLETEVPLPLRMPARNPPAWTPPAPASPP
jgi:hypothetical protein